ncbi:MAG: hypothetical protein VX699_06780 [Myxococcota bacterium]|nr:hypothetical protein [Myxococcota bacterium]
MRRARWWSVGFVLAFVTMNSCGPEPVYDRDIGVQAVSVKPGALSGTFGIYSVASTLVSVPLLGDQDGGGVNYLLVRRTYNKDGDYYEQRSQLCGGYNFEVSGVRNGPPSEVYQLVPESEDERLEVNHERGTYSATGLLQLWGLRGLEDPHLTTLPKNATQATKSPFKEMIYDMDEDGKQGVTALVRGLVSGKVYFIQRRKISFQGVTLGEDRSVGLAEASYEMVFLGDTIRLWDPGTGGVQSHPDPKMSWFEEVRLPDDADCEALLSAVETGKLQGKRPF